MVTSYQIGRLVALEKNATTKEAFLPALIAPALLGGAFGGGISALTADRGDRMNAFIRGAIPGALTGAAGGALGLGAGKLISTKLPGLASWAAQGADQGIGLGGRIARWPIKDITSRYGMIPGTAAATAMPSMGQKPKQPEIGEQPEPLPMTNIPWMAKGGSLSVNFIKHALLDNGPKRNYYRGIERNQSMLGEQATGNYDDQLALLRSASADAAFTHADRGNNVASDDNRTDLSPSVPMTGNPLMEFNP